MHNLYKRTIIALFINRVKDTISKICTSFQMIQINSDKAVNHIIVRILNCGRSTLNQFYGVFNSYFLFLRCQLSQLPLKILNFKVDQFQKFNQLIIILQKEILYIMQVRQGPTKPKYKISDFAQSGNSAINKQVFSLHNDSCKLRCICKKFNKNESGQCSRCFAYVHRCLLKEMPVKTDWECLHCQAKFLDPVFSVDQILLETIFRTQLIFQYANQIQFEFDVTQQQLDKPIELRGLQEGRDGLAWPMQGELLLNKQKNPQPFYSFKPLLSNSNRKHRKQEPIILPLNFLKTGRNTLQFRIPRLNGKTFRQKYQCEERGTYYFGIYSINKLSRDQLISKVFKQSKIQKQQSLQLLKTLTGHGDPQLSVQKVKLNLECPYSKFRIKVPVRGKKCPHYTCLCLQTLIQTRATMPTRQWNCPICDNKVNEPIIDMFVLSILNDGTGGIQVMLSVSGEYTWLAFDDDSESDDDSIQIKKPIKSKDKNPISIQASKPKQKAEKAFGVSRKQSHAVNQQKKKEIIEINLDDSPEIQVANQQTDRNIDQNEELEIIVPEQYERSRAQIQMQNRQKVKEALKKKKQKIVAVQQSQLLISDIKTFEFRSITNRQYTRHFNIEYQPRASKVADDINLMFAEFKEIL